MPAPNKATLTSSYHKTMDDMRQKLGNTERIWSKTIHSPIGLLVGNLFGILIFRPRPILIGSIIALITLISVSFAALIYSIPVNSAESFIAFTFGWFIGVLYDLFFIATKRHTR